MKATAEITIERPANEVWDYVSDVTNMDNWVDGVEGAREVSESSLSVGSLVQSKYSYRGKTFDMDYEVTKYEPRRYLGMRSTKGPFPFDGLLELREEGERETRALNTIEVGSDSLFTSFMFTVFAPLMSSLMRRQLGKELRRLKNLLESPSADNPCN